MNPRRRRRLQQTRRHRKVAAKHRRILHLLAYVPFFPIFWTRSPNPEGTP